jgi:quercetin dioxygenase-like cupin family protein
MGDVMISRFADGEWAEEGKPGENTTEQLERARRAGYRRKRLLAGEGGVFLTHVEMGPGFTVTPHTHDVQEVIHVVAGSLLPDGVDAELRAGDSLVVPAHAVYGFRVGAEGVTFLIYRPAAAGIVHLG